MILTIHRHVISRIPRYSVTYDNSNTWLLHVNQAQQEDRGWVMEQFSWLKVDIIMSWWSVVMLARRCDSILSKREKKFILWPTAMTACSLWSGRSTRVAALVHRKSQISFRLNENSLQLQALRDEIIWLIKTHFSHAGTNRELFSSSTFFFGRYYMCQVNTNPMISQVGYLQVVGKIIFKLSHTTFLSLCCCHGAAR